MRKHGSRLAVAKNIQAVHRRQICRVSENGRVLPARDQGGAILANYCRASRKDFRDAVTAARAAVAGGRSRARICAARFCIARRKCWRCAQGELKEELTRANGQREKSARNEIASRNRSARSLRGLDGQIQSGVRRGESGGQLAFQFHNPGTDRRGRHRLSGRTSAARVSFRWLRR